MRSDGIVADQLFEVARHDARHGRAPRARRRREEVKPWPRPAAPASAAAVVGTHRTGPAERCRPASWSTAAGRSAAGAGDGAGTPRAAYRVNGSCAHRLCRFQQTPFRQQQAAVGPARPGCGWRPPRCGHAHRPPGCAATRLRCRHPGTRWARPAAAPAVPQQQPGQPIRRASPPDRPKPRSPITCPALRQALGKLHYLRGLGDRAQARLAGTGIGQAQVVGDAAVEQVGPRWHIGHLYARPHLQRRHGWQPPGQRLQQRALAGTAGTDQRQALARSSSTSRCSTSCGAPTGAAALARSGGDAASAGSTASGTASLSIRPCSSGSDCSRRSTSAAAAGALARSWYAASRKRGVELRRQQQAEQARAQCRHRCVQRHHAR